MGSVCWKCGGAGGARGDALRDIARRDILPLTAFLLSATFTHI